MLNPQLRPRLLATALIAVALILGGLAGATFDRALFRANTAHQLEAPLDAPRPGPHPRPRPRTRYLDQLTNELDLTDGQRAEVDSLLKEQQDRIRELRQETRQRSSAIIAETRAQIFEILTPEQRAALRRRPPRPN